MKWLVVVWLTIGLVVTLVVLIAVPFLPELPEEEEEHGR
jgi:hypothetical protein